MKGKSSPKSSWLSVKSNRKTCVLELKNSLSSIGLMLASPLQRASKKSIRSTRLWPRWTLRQRQMQNIVVEAPLVGKVSVGVVAMVHLALASVPIADLDVVAVVAVVAAVAVSPRPTLKLRLKLKLKLMQNIVVEATLVGMASVGVAATVPSALASVPIADLDVVAVVAVVAAVAVLPRPMLKPKLTLKLKQMLNVAMVAAIGVIIMATTNLGATTDATLESR